MEKKHSDLAHRTLINGLSAIVIAFFIIIGEYGPFRWLFTGAVAAIAATALWEYYQLVKKKALSPAFSIGLVAVILYVFAVFFKTQGPHSFLPSLWQNGPEIILGLTFFACFVYFAINGRSPITNISTSFLGIVYIGVPLALILRVIYFFVFDGKTDPHFEGSWWLLYLIIVTKSADMGGYFVGGSFGRRKLAFKLSPNKTFEGAIGGLAVAIGVSVLLAFLGPFVGHVFLNFTYIQAIILGAIVGIFGQLGDLAESLLKRDAGIKDSNALPGVGGVLDMVDSLLFTSPVVYIFLRIHYT